MSIGGLNSTVLRAAAVNAIGNAKDNDVLIEAAHEREKAAIQQDLASKEIAASLQQVQGYYQLAMDGVNLAQGAQKVGEAANTLGQRSEAMPQLQQHTADARTELGAGQSTQDSHAFQDLRNTRIGDRTVGERFSDRQLELVTRGDFTEQDLRDAGFSDDERRALMDAKNDRDGFTTDDASRFLWDNRKTSQEVKGEKFRNDLEKAIKENLNLAVSSLIDGAKKEITESGAKAKEDGAKAHDLVSELGQQSLEHTKAIDKIDVEMLRMQSGGAKKQG